MNKNIAVVYGGFSKEEIVSHKSAEQVFNWIDSTKYNKYKILITNKKWVAVINDTEYKIDRSNFSFNNGADNVTFDCVVMVIHGTPGEDGKLQSYFEMLGIPVTTCDSFVSALTFNKFACKSFLKEFKIPTAKAILLRKNDPVNTNEIVASYNFV